MPEYAGDVRAPDFPPDADWINTGHPLTLRDLRGKIVLLDFWTYCCINCMHILPDLQRLERKYAAELVVIGVHSAKFTAERDTENVRQAVLRYQIEHPVINDPQMYLWRQYAVRAWPSVVLIDPQGKVIGGHSGEGIYELFDQIIAKVIGSFDGEGLLDRRPLHLERAANREPRSLLAFPGKVLADAASGRLFIADSNHHRIVVASLADGAVQEVIGGFHHPNGLALDGNYLYVADTGNHAVRRVDLATRRVETLAGTLNSPWDLVLHDGVLYVAMAGSHQLWRLDLETRELGVYAGSGAEARIDGPLLSSALAQPSGIATDGRRLYFADSETSSIRSADLDEEGLVTTIVGEDLFDYGDIDGSGGVVRLQHPLGVVWVEGVLYVADTYNNKIKQIYPETRAARTFAGTGRAGLRDGPLEQAEFDEPAGISSAGGKLYVADTNNHVIRVIDPVSRQVSTLVLREIPRLARWETPVERLEPRAVRAGDAELQIVLELPEGCKWNTEAPVEAFSSVADGEESRASCEPGAPVVIRFHAPEGESVLRVDLIAYYCRAGRETACLFSEHILEIPLQAAAGGPAVLSLHRRLI